jgi:hypothetical protein
MQTIKLSFFMVCENAPPLAISTTLPGEIHLVVEQPLQNPFELDITGGTPPYSVAITGNSFGASFSPSTGNLLAPTSYSGGPAPLKFTVTDSLGASIEKSFTLYSHPQLILHPAPQQTINNIVTSTISFPSLTTFGGYLGKTYSISSNSPSSLASLSATMDPATGIFTILPTTLTPGNYTFLIDVTNSNATYPFTITSTAFIVIVT